MFYLRNVNYPLEKSSIGSDLLIRISASSYNNQISQLTQDRRMYQISKYYSRTTNVSENIYVILKRKMNQDLNRYPPAESWPFKLLTHGKNVAHNGTILLNMMRIKGDKLHTLSRNNASSSYAMPVFIKIPKEILRASPELSYPQVMTDLTYEHYSIKLECIFYHLLLNKAECFII